MLLSQRKESEIKQLKEIFIKDGQIPEASRSRIRPEILASWERCRKSGIDPKCSSISLPSFIPDNKPQKDGGSWALSDILYDDVLQEFYELLENNYSAILCAHSDTGIVYFQRGDKKLLQQINDSNIKIGTCLKEYYLGTTALSLGNIPNQPFYVYGEEHYLDIFQSLATWCHYSKDYGSTLNFIVTSKKDFSLLSLAFLKLFFTARKYRIDLFKNMLELNLKNQMANQFMQYQDQAYIFVDSLGKILNVNQFFYDLFHMVEADVIGKDCLQVFPVLNNAIKCLETGEKINFEEVCFDTLPNQIQFMRMNVTPLQESNGVKGLIISLSDSKKVRQTVNKISNNNAYYNFNNIIGESSTMKNIKRRAMRAALSESTVIITGESGTGKELFAQAIHNASRRGEGPLVALNCGAMPPELIASELFGYIEGAFTGARKGGSMGKFEYAQHGTLFLDEIGEMPLHAQTILLRVLEDRKVTRIGSNTSVEVDVRLVCATNKDLWRMVIDGTFREDLYYRINVVNIPLPPLRERITDIPLLVDHFITNFNALEGTGIKGISPSALSFLIGREWEGNLRELRNTIECAMQNATDSIIELEHLPVENFRSKSEHLVKAADSTNEFAKAEKKRLLNLMIEYNGNKTIVAEKLGICRSTLYRKLKIYNLS